MSNSEVRDKDSDANSGVFETLDVDSLRAELDGPNEIEALFSDAADLERLGLMLDAERIRESVTALVRKFRRKWLMSSNYFPWNDEEWVACSTVVPEEMLDHPEFLDGCRAILEDVERVRERHSSEQTNGIQMPHVTVPFYMPLARSIALADALPHCSPAIRQSVATGTVRLLALAHGTMVEGEESRAVQFILFVGKLSDDESIHHYVYHCIEEEVELAVLIDGDGLRFMEDRPLTQDEAIAFWMGGFLGWNEKCPGLYRLRYARINS